MKLKHSDKHVSKSAAAFLILSQSVLDGEDEKTRTEQYEFLSSLFPLTHRELDVLSLILTQGWGFMEIIRFAKEHGIRNDEIWNVWDNLMAKKYIYLISSSVSSESNCFTDDALTEAILMDRPIGDVQDEKVIKDFLFTASDLFELCTPKKKEKLPFEPADSDDDLLPSVQELVEKVESTFQSYPSCPFSQKMRDTVAGLEEGSKLLLYALTGWFYLYFVKPVRETDLEGPLGKHFESRIGPLLKKHLAVSCYVWDVGNDRADTNNYRISPSFAEFFKGHEEIIDPKFLSDAGTFTTPNEIQKKELFFNEINLAGIRRLSAATGQKAYDLIIGKLKERGLTPNLSAIFYGPPGTGKTELARQIARETGRSLLYADLSKLEGIYVGESPVRYRNLFQAYRYTCAISRCCPILFLDEADGILGARIQNVTSSVGKHDNMNQNIILEELNSLPGIIFATTNLISNIDEATRRRFKMALEFPLPDAPTRARLWASKYPTLSASEAEEVGRRFAISGGVIDNIVSTAIMDEILENRAIRFADIVRYCEDRGLNTSTRRRIGF